MDAVAATAEGTARPELIPGEAPRPATPAAKLPQPEPTSLEPTIYRFTLKYSLKQQLSLIHI